MARRYPPHGADPGDAGDMPSVDPCGEDEYWDPVQGKCVKFGGGDAGKKDKGTSTSTGTATPKCPKGFAWSEQYKVCIEVPKRGKCPPGYLYDPKKKLCISRDTVAPEGFAWSEEYKTYIELPKQPRCPEGYHWDPKKKACLEGEQTGRQGKNWPEGMIGPGWGGRSAQEAASQQMMEGTGSGIPGEEAQPGSTEGGSASGGFGGEGEPKEPDPNQPLIDAGVRLYFNLWGQVPPAGYIEGLVSGGKSLFEIEANERGKPEFIYSPEGKRAKADVEGEVARMLGVF